MGLKKDESFVTTTKSWSAENVIVDKDWLLLEARLLTS